MKVQQCILKISTKPAKHLASSFTNLHIVWSDIKVTGRKNWRLKKGYRHRLFQRQSPSHLLSYEGRVGEVAWHTAALMHPLSLHSATLCHAHPRIPAWPVWRCWPASTDPAGTWPVHLKVLVGLNALSVRGCSGFDWDRVSFLHRSLYGAVVWICSENSVDNTLML